jgi:hypothetical protein
VKVLFLVLGGNRGAADGLPWPGGESDAGVARDVLGCAQDHETMTRVVESVPSVLAGLLGVPAPSV